MFGFFAYTIILLGSSFGISTGFGLFLAAAFTGIILKKSWESWTINPDNLQIWYTKDSITGATRFFGQGLNLKFPWEKRVTGDAHSGIITLNRTITEEDMGAESKENQFVTPDGATVSFDWQLDWWPNVVDTAGNIIPKNCLAYIKTDIPTKKLGIRGRMERFLTALARENSSDLLRDKTREISAFVESGVFLPVNQACEEEINYGVVVGTPQFKGVFDSEQIKKARGFVKEAELAGDVARNLGKPSGHDDVLIFMGKKTGSVVKIDAPAGMRSVVMASPRT